MLAITHSPHGDTFFDMLDAVGSPIFVIEKLDAGVYEIVHLNSYYQSVLDLDADEMIGAPIHEIFPQRIAEVLAERYDMAFEGDEPLRYDEVLRLSGTTITWRTTLSRAPLGRAGRPRIIGVAIPIEDLKAREIALASEVAQLRATLTELRTLARLSAHDLRAPLANVSSLTKVILEDFHDHGNGKAEMIRACGEIAITSLAAIDALMQRFRTDLPPSARHDVADLRAICRGVVALADPAGRLDILHPTRRILCDSTVLTVAIRNLVDNAVRYAASRIEISLEESSDAQGFRLIVADDGPGFGTTDPISQALAGTQRSDGRGFGLGAVIALLRSRGGDLRLAAPRLGSGATFEIALPGEIIEGEPLSDDIGLNLDPPAQLRRAS